MEKIKKKIKSCDKKNDIIYLYLLVHDYSLCYPSTTQKTIIYIARYNMKVVSFPFPFPFLLLSVFLCNIFTVSGFLTPKGGIPQPTHISSIEKSWTM